MDIFLVLAEGDVGNPDLRVPPLSCGAVMVAVVVSAAALGTRGFSSQEHVGTIS